MENKVMVNLVEKMLAKYGKELNENKVEKCAEIITAYLESSDNGKYGNTFEVLVRTLVRGMVETRRCASKLDTTVKASKKGGYVGIECKTNCGMLASGLTKEDAEKMVKAGKVTSKAKYIVYCPMFRKAPDIKTAHVMLFDDFVKLLAKYNLLRVKKQSNGTFAVSIQNYLPTEHFTGLRRGQDFLADFGNYPTLAEFIEQNA